MPLKLLSIANIDAAGTYFLDFLTCGPIGGV